VAEQTVIREFLVALGYKTDETAAKKFVGGIETSTKAVIKLGAVVEGVALAVAIGVARFASNLEALYFASMRTGSSADQLQAFSLAMQNFGASADDAMGAVENLASFLRKNPGGENFIAGWLREIGIDSKNLHGPIDQLKALGKLFQYQRAHGQTYLSEQIAGQLGISEKSMLAMSTPGFDAELDKQIRLSKGWESAAKAAHAFEMALRDVKRQLEQVLLPLASDLLAGEGGLISKLSQFFQHHGKQIVRDIRTVVDAVLRGLGSLLDWLDTHGNEIQRRIDETFGEINTVYQVIKPAMVWLYDQFVALDKATDGWSTKLIVLLGTLKLIGATGLVTGIASMGAALAKSLGVAAVASEGTGAWAAAGAAWGSAAAIVLGVGLGAIINKAFPDGPLAHVGDSLASFIGDEMDKYNASRWALLHNQPAPTPGQVYKGNYPWVKPTPAEGSGNVTNVTFDTDISVDASDQIMGDQNLARVIASEFARQSKELIREFAVSPR
jgi:hypothetical protein